MSSDNGIVQPGKRPIQLNGVTARIGEWGVAASMGAVGAAEAVTHVAPQVAPAVGAYEWVPIVTGVLSLLIRLLPMIFRSR